uniref:DAZ-associated protein 2 n=1 Tax=Saccoglossus kowalevskii TaxID=10224 RepID=A0ABM0MDQ6_SACKO|nr:PREDICTED: calcium-binding protein P-like isoform X2 [Saccoglossus kowalevskii]
MSNNEKQGQYPPQQQQQQPHQPYQVYPAAPAYPTGTGQYPMYAMPQQQQPAGGFPQEPPPPYTPPQQQQYGQMGGYPHQQPYQQQPYPAPNSTVVVPNAFDAGARFGVGSSVNIPPPPPGVAPNAAQIAAMRGDRVVAGKKKGLSSGGSSWF